MMVGNVGRAYPWYSVAAVNGFSTRERQGSTTQCLRTFIYGSESENKQFHPFYGRIYSRIFTMQLSL